MSSVAMHAAPAADWQLNKTEQWLTVQRSFDFATPTLD